MDQIAGKRKVFHLFFSRDSLQPGHVLKRAPAAPLQQELLWLYATQILKKGCLLLEILLVSIAGKCLGYLLVQHLAERIHDDSGSNY